MDFIALYSIFGTGFVKRGLPHTSITPTLTIHNATDLKFGQQEAPT